MPLSALATTGIEAAGAVAGSVASGLFGANQARKNRKFQERMYYQQLEDNRENWRMVNEYNLPSAALQRIKDAGLNPLLYYTGQASPQAGNIASPQAPSGSQSPGMPAVNPFANLGKNIAAMQNLEAQQRNLNSDSTLKLAQARAEIERAKDLAASAGEHEAGSFQKKYEGLRAKSEYDYNTRSLELRIRYQELQNQFQEALTNTETHKVDLIVSEQKKNEAAVDDLYNQMENRDRLTTAQIDKMHNEVEQLIKRTAHEISLMDAEARKASAEAYVLEVEGALKSMPEYMSNQLRKQQEEVRLAILKGDEQYIRNTMSVYIWNTMPKYDASSMSYRKWLKNYVEPATNSLGQLLGGSGAALIGGVLK